MAAPGDNEVRVDITADVSGLKAGTAEATAQMKKLEDSTKMTAAEATKLNQQMKERAAQLTKTSASTKQYSESLSSLDDELAQFLTRANPAYAAQMRLDQGNDLLNRGLKAGLISQTTYNESLSLLGKQYSDAKEKLAGFAGGMEKGAFATVQARRELVVLGHEAVSGNFSRIPGSLMVLAERSNLSMGALVGIGGAGLLAAAGIGAVVVAAIQGQHELDAMNHALATTGDYVGTTVGQMKLLAHSVADSGAVTIGTASSIATQVAASGTIMALAYRPVVEAVAQYARVTGQSADDSVKNVVKLFDDPAKGATELNRTMHLLTAGQIEYIRQLQESGREGEAQKQLADDLKEKLTSVTTNLGYLERGWNAVARAGSSAWHAMMDFGAGKTVEDQLKSVNDKINLYRAKAAQNKIAFGYDASSDPKELASLLKQQADLQKQIGDAASKANKEAADGAREQVKTEIDAAYATKTHAGEIAKLRAEIGKYQGMLKTSPQQSDKLNALINTDKDRLATLLKPKKTAASSREKTWADDMAAAIKDADAELKQYAEDESFVAKGDMDRLNAINAQKQAWVEAGRALEVAMQTPMEKANIEFGRLDEMLSQGVISWETYSRAVISEQDKVDAALNRTKDKGKDQFAELKQAVEGWGKDASKTFADWATGSKTSIADVGKAWINEFIQMMAYKKIFEPAASAVSGAVSGFMGALFSAQGNAFSSDTGLAGYRNSVVDRPTMFAFAQGVGLMGEKPGSPGEAIMPLTRMQNGDLGVKVGGSGGGATVVVNLIESPGNGGKTEQRQDSGGTNILDVYVEKIKASIAGDISTGRGAIPSAMSNTYGLNRVAGAY